MEERKILEDFGCKDIEYTNLVNNYYINFTYKDERFTVEHILNVYGAEVNFWELFSLTGPSECFKTLEELLNHIK